MSQRASHKLGAQFSVTISMDGSRQEPEEQKHQSDSNQSVTASGFTSGHRPAQSPTPSFQSHGKGR